MDADLRADLARALGMKTSEITAVEHTAEGFAVTTHDGQTVVLDAPAGASTEAATGPEIKVLEKPQVPVPPVPEGVAYEVPTGSARAILAWVGGDSARAAAAAHAEEQADSPRITLLTDLRKVIG